MNRLRLLIVWTATSLVLLFLLHPPIVLEVHDGTRWVGSAAYHEWLWKIPAIDVGVRWRADFSAALIASLATTLVAAAAFATVRDQRPSANPKIQHIPKSPAPVWPDAGAPLPVNVLPDHPPAEILQQPPIATRCSVLVRTDEPGEPWRLLFLQCADGQRDDLLAEWGMTTNRLILERCDYLNDTEAHYEGIDLHQEFFLDVGHVREMRNVPPPQKIPAAPRVAAFGLN